MFRAVLVIVDYRSVYRWSRAFKSMYWSRVHSAYELLFSNFWDIL